MIVAFWACALRLEAPWVWALAKPNVPSTKAAAATVIVIFRIRPFSWVLSDEV
jgi:hypothetical protein